MDIDTARREQQAGFRILLERGRASGLSSMAALKRLIGFDYASWSRWANGKQPITTDHVMKILRVVNPIFRAHKQPEMTLVDFGLGDAPAAVASSAGVGDNAAGSPPALTSREEAIAMTDLDPQEFALLCLVRGWRDRPDRLTLHAELLARAAVLQGARFVRAPRRPRRVSG